MEEVRYPEVARLGRPRGEASEQCRGDPAVTAPTQADCERGGLRGGDPAAAVVGPQARDRTPARVAASSSPQIPESQKPRENQQTPLSS